LTLFEKRSTTTSSNCIIEEQGKMVISLKNWKEFNANQ
jgi:hypothetical protein